jgi:2-isopropylmalate synthase
VVYDAEHFFDGYRDDPGYALDCLRAAGRRGAETVRPVRHQRLVAAAAGGRGDRAVLAASATACASPIHCHNDAECGVANTLAAVEAARARCRAR